MTRQWGRVTVALSLLLATEMLGPRACAWPQEPGATGGASPPVETNTSDASNQRGSGTSRSRLTPEPGADPKSDEYTSTLGRRFLEHLAQDQQAIWTSPFKLRFIDADWLVPLGMATGGLLATDTEFSKHLSNSPSRLRNSNNFSNFGIAAMAGAGAGFYFLGQITHDEHKSETGFLAGEAAIDSLAVTYGLKYAFGRERPLQDNYQGNFWSGGDSFPSEHATAAWAIASVVAHEYPGPLTQLLAYGAASAISLSRITAKQHFPSDVLIGSAVGWLVGRYVYRAHHDPTIGGGEWSTYAESQDEGPDRKVSSAGSPYVELDSWIYPALERLVALGYIRSAYLGQRPWTRIQCALLVEEAGERIGGGEGIPADVNGLYLALANEFRKDLEVEAGPGELSGRIESIYSGVTGISGPPLNDSTHFGQTIINNYGRPYQEGFNTVDGFSAYGTAGRFTLYVRGEYQYAPSAPAYSEQVRTVISNVDGNPIQPATPVPTVNQFTLLDTYVAATFSDWNLSFGKQSLWWGPGYGGDLIFSDNAAPIYMFRATRTTPFTLPWIFRFLGPVKTDFFFGKLSGNQFPPRPCLHGEAISFKPIQDLEVGFSWMSEFGGVGRPLTLAALFNSYFSFQESDNYRPNNNPGKRTAGFNFSYRLPFARNWLTLYFGSLASDNLSPIEQFSRSGVNPGLYVTHFPKLHALDLRIEGVNTNTPLQSTIPGRFIYHDFFYHDLSTNENNIIGSWIGRDGLGFQAWSTYWFSARNSIQLAYRHANVPRGFIPGGESVNDGSVAVNWLIHNDVSLSASVQYELWKAPLLAATPQSNWTTSVGLTFWPQTWRR